jgi:ribosomal protein S18 acetylase RimI-like enzyme
VQDVLDAADRLRRRVRLYTEPDNPARRLYARLGFVAADTGAMHVAMTREPD